nr:hypothetical protein [Tanacetum cinerariifolium]GEZ17380.1 hypothetical protein [Tanacetum cinerariifolium]
EPDEEHVYDMPLDAKENIVDAMSNADEQLDGEAALNTDNAPKNDWFKQPPRPPNPDPEAHVKVALSSNTIWKNAIKLWLTNLSGKILKVIDAHLNLTNHLPLKGHLTVAVEYFFNNDLEYLKSKDSERKYTMPITKMKEARSQLNRFSKHDAYSSLKILSVVSVKVNKMHNYGYLEEIVHKLFHLNGDVIVDLAVALLAAASPRRVRFMATGSYSMDKHQYIMKAQVHVTQVFCYSDTQISSLKCSSVQEEAFQERLFDSSQDKEKYEHVDPKVTSSQGGKKI